MTGLEDVIQRLEKAYAHYSAWLVKNKLNVRDRTETIDYRDGNGKRKVNMKLLSIDSQVRWRLENFIDEVNSQLNRLTDSAKLKSDFNNVDLNGWAKTRTNTLELRLRNLWSIIEYLRANKRKHKIVQNSRSHSNSVYLDGNTFICGRSTHKFNKEATRELVEYLLPRAKDLKLGKDGRVSRINAILNNVAPLRDEDELSKTIRTLNNDWGKKRMNVRIAKNGNNLQIIIE